MVRLAVLAILATATAAHAEPRDDYFTRLAAAVHEGLDQLIAARPPTLVPPVRVPVTWKAVRLGSLDLGAPLVAMAAGDVDGDGKAEIYAVTAHDLVAIGLATGKPKELARVPFGGEPAVQRPRDTVGTVIIDGRDVIASVSTWGTELRASWNAKVFVGRPGDPGFLVCPGERLGLVPGRDHFGDVVAPLYGVRCRADLVDADGGALRVRGALVGTKLEVTVESCRSGTCQPARKHAYKDYGAAFELADIDRDGTPEVIVTGAGAPGDPDAVKVISVGKDDKKGVFRKTFNGGVAAIAVVDGAVVVAVRLLGSTRVDLWRLN
ncbi:MAG: hypothetical protein SFX73_14495 [Kofleriaceae bacterium]|nr:hypothetical protein [Kofleriaceae bacterium]